jgi:hypothetical protein
MRHIWLVLSPSACIVGIINQGKNLKKKRSKEEE